MKILLSAYACEPNKGSEPGVGWGWAIELAQYHDVWVITRDNNKITIETYQNQYPQYKMDKLHFVYVGLSRKMTFWKKGRRGMRLFYMMWQRKAVKVARKWNDKIHFDLVHHVTFVSYTQPTYMYKLKIPLIWGPISGGENIPKCIHVDMSLRDHVVEISRKLSQKIALLAPSIRKSMKMSNCILVTTMETKDKIPEKYLYKTLVMPAIGLEKLPDIREQKKNDDKVRIIMAGRLIYWKAFDIGMKAYLQIADKYPNTELHILGEGNKKVELKKLAGNYINKQIFFDEPIPHDEIFGFYQGFDIFLNTTLRDSGCMTMMEAMAVGMPCICIATGGPKELACYADNVVGINVQGRNSLIHGISEELEKMITNITGRAIQYERSSQLLYKTKVMLLYNNCYKGK